MNEPGLKGCF